MTRVVGLWFSLLLFGVSVMMPVFAEETQAEKKEVPEPDGYMLFSWSPSLSIVDQLQVIHRYGHTPTEEAVNGLVDALESPIPLARRKASSTLVQKATSIGDKDKPQVVSHITPFLQATDPVVRSNVVRFLARLHHTASQASLRRFFQSSDKAMQLAAVDTLSHGGHDHYVKEYHEALDTAIHASPFPEVRSAAIQARSSP